jgi:hypothetical protein
MRSLFRSLNPGQARSGKDISFRDLVFRNQIERFARELYFSFRDRTPSAHWFRGNVHHLGAAIAADMTETFLHYYP